MYASLMVSTTAGDVKRSSGGSERLIFRRNDVPWQSSSGRTRLNLTVFPTKLKKADVLLLFLKKHGLMSGYNIVA